MRGLNRAGVFHDVDLEVRAGEIVGLAGLVGAGRSEVARAVFGVDPYDSGSVSISGKDVKAHDPRAAIRAGMAFIPEDRRKQGLVIDSSVTRNVAGVIRRGIAKGGLLTSAMENRAAGPWASRLEVKTSALDMNAATMSGGNQQKVVIAKWLATQPKLLIIDEPTRGIDVGTKAEVHRLLSELAGQGLAILMISSELPEVLGMADRVLVLCEGRITAELDRADATPRGRHARRHPPPGDRPMNTDIERTEPDTEVSAGEALLVEPSRLSPTRRALTTVLRSRELSIFLVLVAVVVLATSKNNSFLFSSDGWRNFLLNPSILVLLAVGQGVVIITRNVDLSVGSVMALTAYLTGRLFVDQPGLPIVAVIAACLLLGAALGLVNGLLVAYGKVPALVITLGTLYIYRGIMLTWAGSDRINAGDLPREFLRLGTRSVLGVPALTIIAVVVLAAVGYYLHTARGGRELYAIGSDPDAAVLYGLPVRRRLLAAFVLSGALAGLAGALYTARYGTVSSSVGSGIELQAVAAAVIGGIAIFGGSGTVWGAAIGAFLLVTINRALPSLGIEDFWQRAVVGALILGAIVLDRVLATRQARKLAESRDRA